MNISAVPEYQCSEGDVAGHMRRFLEWLRLISSSQNSIGKLSPSLEKEPTSERSSSSLDTLMMENTNIDALPPWIDEWLQKKTGELKSLGDRHLYLVGTPYCERVRQNQSARARNVPKGAVGDLDRKSSDGEYPR